ncbi:hypothetical protein TNCV_2521921 [Trichonephila clavipes]|nr:hypothetical protein TNCV_2521921 [Trichonephila clavipes]
MLIQPASSQPGLVKGTVVLLENSITLRITEQHKRIDKRIALRKVVKQCHEKTPQTRTKPLCPCTVPT